MKSKPLKLSIVIPVYNEEDYLDTCLLSIAKQSQKPFEVIVVDNGSDDNSQAIAKRYKFVRIVNEPIRGIVHARNQGFNAARGDIIGRIDADSVLPEDWVETVTKFFETTAEKVAFTGGAKFDVVGVPKIASSIYNWLTFRFNYFLTGTPTLWGSNMAIERQHWLRVRNAVCSDRAIHEDLDLTLHLNHLGVYAHYDPDLKVDATLRRINSDNSELWDYLNWWPNTLKTHYYRSWPVCWAVGCFVPFIVTLSYKAVFGLTTSRPVVEAPDLKPSD